MEHFPVILKLRLDWSEMDMFGHINNVMYFKYIQASRVNYWEATHLVSMFSQNKIGPILASTGCQFIRPLHYPGNVIIKARVEFIKNTSFGIHHTLWNDEDELSAEAHDVIVMYDFNKNDKVAIPPSFRSTIEELEQKKF